MTLDEWSHECWDLLGVRPRTLLDYQRKYRKWIKPTFGDKPIGEITRRQVQAWMLTLSPTIGRAVLPILKTLFREALLYDVEGVEANPTIGVKRKKHVVARREFLPLEEIEKRDFGNHREMFLFLAKHGLRYSEMVNLRATDFVTVGGKQFINVQRSEGGLTPKSGRSRLVPYLGHWSPDFPKNYKWSLHVFHEATGGLTIHSLRKTYAYWLKRKGVPPQTAQKFLGHSTIVLTMDLYTDVTPDDLGDAAEMLTM